MSAGSNDLELLLQRLKVLNNLPDGILHDQITPLHHIQIIKDAGQIQFYFVDPCSGALDGPMSRIELDRPLRLLAGYTQAAMLTLLWNPVPKRICLLGMAGGRLALLFYHHFPATVIDNVDIDPAIIPIATQYFGITFDKRQRITIQDARAFLSAEASQRYDIIIMDAFRDASDELNHLATRQFYQACRQRLAPSGVLCVNMLKSDRLLFEKIKTFMSSFQQAMIVELKRSLVMFGNQRRQLTHDQIVATAASLQRRHAFNFPFEERAATLQSARAIAAYSSQALRDVIVLDDQDISS
jgi:spermidine synthase